MNARRLLSFAAFFLAATCLADDAGTRPASGRVRDDSVALEGEWRVVARTFGEKVVPPDGPDREEVTVTLRAGLLTRRVDRRPCEWEYRLGPSHSPRRLDLYLTGRGEPTFLGVYVREGDRVKVCFGYGPRPVGLEPRGWDIAETWERVKP